MQKASCREQTEKNIRDTLPRVQLQLLSCGMRAKIWHAALTEKKVTESNCPIRHGNNVINQEDAKKGLAKIGRNHTTRQVSPLPTCCRSVAVGRAAADVPLLALDENAPPWAAAAAEMAFGWPVGGLIAIRSPVWVMYAAVGPYNVHSPHKRPLTIPR